MQHIGLLIILIALLAGCPDAPATPPTAPTAPPSTTAPPATPPAPSVVAPTVPYRSLVLSTRRVGASVVHVFKDDESYTKFHQKNNDGVGIGVPPTPVDFKTEEVVAICWGTKGGGGYGMIVNSVTGDARKTTIVVSTRLPTGVSTAALTYPAIVVALPRCERVEVVITGDREPRGDFSNAKTEDLEIIVK